MPCRWLSAAVTGPWQKGAARAVWAAVVIGSFSAVVLHGGCAVCSLVTKEEPHFSEGSRAAVGLYRVPASHSGAGPALRGGGVGSVGWCTNTQLPVPLLVGAGSGGP